MLIAFIFCKKDANNVFLCTRILLEREIFLLGGRASEGSNSGVLHVEGPV
jgi:hypothetical protein